MADFEEKKEGENDILEILRSYANSKSTQTFDAFLLGNELTCTNPDPCLDDDQDSLWDSLLLGVLQEHLEDYSVGKCETAIRAIRREDDEEHNILSDKSGITKLQVKLELAFNSCKTKSPLQPNGPVSTSTIGQACASQTENLWSLLKSELNLPINLFLFDRESGYVEQLLPADELEGEAAPIIYIYDEELHAFRRIVESHKFYNNDTKAHCDNILEKLVANQELTRYLYQVLSNIEAEELHGFIATSLENLARLRTLKETAELIASLPTDPITDAQLSHLQVLVRKEPKLLAQENDDGEKLLRELHSVFSYSLLQACKEVLEEKMADARQKCIELQEEEDRLVVENDRLETLIAEAEAEKAEREQKIRDLEESLKKADARQKELIEQEIEQLRRLNAQRGDLERHKEAFAWNDFKNKLIAVQVSYEIFQSYAMEMGKWRSSETLLLLVQMLSSTFSILDLSELPSFCELNDTQENREELFTILGHLFQPPKISFCPNDNSILEVSGMYILTSQLMEKVKGYTFREIRIMASSSIFVDSDFPKDVFHGKNVAICAPKMNVMKPSVINTSGYNGKPERIPGQATSGQYDGRDGFDGQDGTPGESAGNVYIRVLEEITNADRLEIQANGGDGGQGQDGGHGMSGKDGYDGRNGEVANQSWWTSRVCYKIDRGWRGQEGQRGGSGGAAGLGGVAGLRGQVDILPSNPGIKVTHEDGRQGRDGTVGQGGTGGTGGRNGADHGVAWHNYKFAGGEFRYARGQLDVKRQRVWYGGNGYTLIVHRNEWDVRNSRANRGENAVSGQSKTNAKSRQKASVNKQIQKDQVQRSFTSVVQMYGSRSKEQGNLLKQLQQELASKQASVDEATHQAQMDTSARNNEQNAIAQKKTSDQKDLKSEQTRRAELISNIAGLNENVRETLESLGEVQAAKGLALVETAETVKSLKNQMEQIAATVQHHRRQGAEAQMEAVRRGQHQLTRQMSSKGTIRRRDRVAPTQIKPRRKANVKDSDKIVEQKIILKEKDWIRRFPKEWSSLQKIVAPKVQDLEGLFHFLRTSDELSAVARIEKIQGKMTKLKFKEEPYRLIRRIHDLLHRRLQTWFQTQVVKTPTGAAGDNGNQLGIVFDKEGIDNLCTKVNLMYWHAVDSEALSSEAVSLTSTYKFLLNILNDPEILKEAGDTMWEAVALELTGFTDSTFFFFKAQQTAEEILITRLSEVHKILETQTKLLKRNQAISLLKKIEFVLSYVEVGDSLQEQDEQASLAQLKQLDKMSALLEKISFLAKYKEDEILNLTMSIKDTLYFNYVQEFQLLEVRRIEEKLDAFTGTPEDKANLKNLVNARITEAEDPFSGDTFESRIKAYSKWNKNLEGEGEANVDNPKSFFSVPEILERLKKFGSEIRRCDTWKTRDIQNVFQELQITCFSLSARPEKLGYADLLQISQLLDDCCGLVASALKENLPPVIIQSVRNLHTALFPHWKAHFDRRFQSLVENREDDIQKSNEWLKNCVELVRSYVEASDKLLFKDDVLNEIQIHLVRVLYAHKILGISWTPEGSNQLDSWWRSVQTSMTSKSDPLEAILTFSQSIQTLSQELSLKVFILLKSKIHAEPQKITALENYCRATEDHQVATNLLTVLELERSEPETEDEATTSFAYAIYTTMLLKFPFLSLSHQISKNTKETSATSDSALKTWEAIADLLKQVSLSEDESERQKFQNISTICSLQLKSLDFLMFGKLIQDELVKTADEAMSQIRERWSETSWSVGKILEVYKSNPSILSYSGAIIHFSKSMEAASSSSKSRDDKTDPAYRGQVRKIFVESCCRFFSRNSIQAW